VVISKAITKLAAKPYSDCSYTGKEVILYKKYSDYIDQYKFKYSNAACRNMCVNEKVSVACPFFSNDCVKNFFKDKVYDCYSGCPQECTVEKYDYKLGFLNFPNTVYFNQFNFSRYNMSKDFESLKQITLKLTVRFDKMGYTVIEQEKAMEFIDLISSIGGTLGNYFYYASLKMFLINSDSKRMLFGCELDFYV